MPPIVDLAQMWKIYDKGRNVPEWEIQNNVRDRQMWNFPENRRVSSEIVRITRDVGGACAREYKLFLKIPGFTDEG